LKIRPVGVELFCAGRQTDMKKMNVVIYNFARGLKAPYSKISVRVKQPTIRHN